jgi:septum site-determining protein MinC
LDIKGDRRGLRILAHGFSSEQELLDDLHRTLERHHQFFGRSALTVEVSDLPFTEPLFGGIAACFQAFPDLKLAGVVEAGQARPAPQAVPTTPPQGAHIVRMTLRSGQVIEHPTDIVVVGDVNPGARVISGGDVFVLGRLRGLVMAGQPDREDSTIYAIRFEPSQVRIGTVWAIPPGEAGQRAELARVERGQIVVTPWTGVNEPRESSGHRSQAD